MTLAEAAEKADELAVAGDQVALAALRSQWDDEVEAAARNQDYRIRAQAYRAIAQFRFRQKLELLRRGLEDESPAARGSAPDWTSRVVPPSRRAATGLPSIISRKWGSGAPVTCSPAKLTFFFFSSGSAPRLM